MGQPVSGKTDVRSAPFQRVYTDLSAAIDLTEEIAQAKQAASGLLVVVNSDGAGNLVWTDCSGTSCTLALANSAVVELPFAIKTIEISTVAGSVIAYWHP